MNGRMNTGNLPHPRDLADLAVTLTLHVLASIQWQTVAVTVATVCGTLVALATAWKLPLVSRPLKWLFEKNIAEPLGHLLNRILDSKVENKTLELVTPIAAHLGRIEGQVEHILKELQPNSGKSFRDEIKGFQRVTTEDIMQLREAQSVIVEVLNAKRQEFRKTDFSTYDSGTPGVAYDVERKRVVWREDDPYWHGLQE
jgi:hypothetical protein